ncbi:hypothetical protein Btru_041077, partial [Bulinus truncatus]
MYTVFSYESEEMFYLRDYMLIIFQMSIISEICIGCPHALAGKNYSFYGILKHSLQEKVEIVWLRNKIPVSMCRSNLACYGYDETKTMTSLKYLGNSKYEFNLTLTNVTKMDESIWSLKYLGLASLRQPHFMFSCNLRVFDISILTIQNCPSIVKESSIVHCECSLIENTAINIDFGWYDSTNMIMNNSNHLLVYNASMEEDGYECKGISDAGLNNLPLPYEPLIIATIDNFDCSLHYNKTVFYMLCTFQRIYPEAICDILIEGEELRINIVSNKDNLVHNSYPWPENNRYYSSECFQFLPFILIFENFTAIVTASLNITGTEKDSFSQTKTFHFNPKLLIDESVLLSEINELLSFRICIAVLYLIVVLLLLLFTIMFKK